MHENLREIVNKKYFSRLPKLLKTRLNLENMFSAIIKWAVRVSVQVWCRNIGMEESWVTESWQAHMKKIRYL